MGYYLIVGYLPSTLAGSPPSVVHNLTLNVHKVVITWHKMIIHFSIEVMLLSFIHTVEKCVAMTRSYMHLAQAMGILCGQLVKDHSLVSCQALQHHGRAAR